MAKKETNSYAKGPWVIKHGAIKNYIPVTELNKASVLIIGRILYIIDTLGRTKTFRGTMTIDPCFTKGKFNYPFKPWDNGKRSHYEVYFPEDMNYEEYKTVNRALVEKYMSEKSLYIKMEDPILKYYKI